MTSEHGWPEKWPNLEEFEAAKREIRRLKKEIVGLNEHITFLINLNRVN